MTVTRFAPSPTGYLHLGHAYAALFAAAAGEMRLRIEDIDATRCRPEFSAAILEDLNWLGIPIAGPILNQSARMAVYRKALETLSARGLLYPCFCSRKDIAAAVSAPHEPLASSQDGMLYPGTCRALPPDERARRMANEPYALRLDAAAAARQVGPLWFAEDGFGPNGESGHIKVDPGLFGDVVLARKETFASYHLAVVIDDAYQGVNLVTRGADLFAATHIQISPPQTDFRSLGAKILQTRSRDYLERDADRRHRPRKNSQEAWVLIRTCLSFGSSTSERPPFLRTLAATPHGA